MGDQHIKERLDRAVGNRVFCDHFHNAQVFHLDPIGSDHSPILVNLNFKDNRTSRSFKFEQQ